MFTNSLSLACPNCSSVNTLNSSAIPKDTVIHCSSCRAILGRWDALKEKAATQSVHAHRQHNGARKPG